MGRGPEYSLVKDGSVDISVAHGDSMTVRRYVESLYVTLNKSMSAACSVISRRLEKLADTNADHSVLEIEGKLDLVLTEPPYKHGGCCRRHSPTMEV